jgi:hypothetical protein
VPAGVSGRHRRCPSCASSVLLFSRTKERLPESSVHCTTLDASVVVFKHANGNIPVLDRSGKEPHLTAIAARWVG